MTIDTLIRESNITYHAKQLAPDNLYIALAYYNAMNNLTAHAVRVPPDGLETSYEVRPIATKTFIN